MKVAKKSPPVITPVDRLSLTLCLAIIVHGIIILGITFSPEEVIQPRYETMEIILVQQESEPNKDAEFLAQANLDGGGDSSERVSPSTPLPSPFPDTQPEITAAPESQASPPPQPESSKVETQVTEETLKPAESQEILAAEQENATQPLVESKTEEVKEPEPEKKETEPVETEEVASKETMPEQAESPPMPSATALLTNSFKIASLSAEIRRKMEAKAQRPRRKFISASTKEFKYAAYMEAWRAKVERVGNLNYPDDARKNNLSGSLILDVALNADGSINEITIRRPSGSKVLDDAAIRIVKLSAPFSPFPQQIRDETDILHITRTWQFLNNNRFR